MDHRRGGERSRMNSLVDALLNLSAGTDVRRTYGEVTGTDPLMVRVGGSTVPTPCQRLSSYAPAVGDFVLVLLAGKADRLVLGSIGGEPAGGDPEWADGFPTYD